MARRHVPEVSMGSMADIAFLLLIFFLVATTMDTDVGIMRRLPPIDGEETDVVVNKRNTLVILVNRNNQLLVQGDPMDLTKLRHEAKEFISNKENRDDLPIVKEKYFEGFGNVKVTPGHVISLRSDRGTTYETYIAVQNELVGAYNELRDEAAIAKWGVYYDKLDDIKKDLIADIYPLRISEAEPNF